MEKRATSFQALRPHPKAFLGIFFLSGDSCSASIKLNIYLSVCHLFLFVSHILHVFHYHIHIACSSISFKHNPSITITNHLLSFIMHGNLISNPIGILILLTYKAGRATLWIVIVSQMKKKTFFMLARKTMHSYLCLNENLVTFMTKNLNSIAHYSVTRKLFSMFEMTMKYKWIRWTIPKKKNNCFY